MNTSVHNGSDPHRRGFPDVYTSKTAAIQVPRIRQNGIYHLLERPFSEEVLLERKKRSRKRMGRIKGRAVGVTQTQRPEPAEAWKHFQFVLQLNDGRGEV